MFNRSQWITVAFLYFLGVVGHLILNSTELTSGHIAGAIGSMVPVLIIGLISGAVGRRRGEQAATTGIIIGFLLPMVLMTSDYWA
jgi:hypothetical protein